MPYIKVTATGQWCQPLTGLDWIVTSFSAPQSGPNPEINIDSCPSECQMCDALPRGLVHVSPENFDKIETKMVQFCQF